MVWEWILMKIFTILKAHKTGDGYKIIKDEIDD